LEEPSKRSFSVWSGSECDRYENEAERQWLQALIWPEHSERRERLPAAIEIVRKEKIYHQEGDGVEFLPQLISATPADSLPCVFHTHVANQMTAEQQKQLLDQVDEIGKQRDLCHIHNNMGSHLHDLLSRWQSP
tara:strand:- start:50 stop:451 length:402 start_codon:yes stop_codon:yes gene_type:complete